MEAIKVEQEEVLHVCVERPDGSCFMQLVPDDFYSLLEFKEALGDEYWITEIF